MNSGQGDSLVSAPNTTHVVFENLTLVQEEAVPESLKNIVLVMANGGYLVPPHENPDDSRLWDETWKRLERFLPGMFKEIFPDPVQPAPAAAAPPKPEQIPSKPEGDEAQVK